MNWTYVISAVYIGVIIAIVIGIACQKGWIAKMSALVVALLAAVAGYFLYIHYLQQPKVEQREAQNMTQAEYNRFTMSMDKMPVYQVLKEQEPDLWKNINEQISAMRKEGKSEQEIVEAIQPQILVLQMKRLQQAPDQNVIAYMRVNLQQTAMVQQKSDDDCFRFLFPMVKGGISVVDILPREVTLRRMDIDASMMRSAYGPEKHTVTMEERKQAQEDLQPIMLQLMGKYGENIQLMADPNSAIGQEGVVCNLVQDLWRNVLLLPPEKAAAIIRLSVGD